MTTRRVALASLIFLALLTAFSVLPGQHSPFASARQQRPDARPVQFGHIEIVTTPGGRPLSINGRPAGETAASARIFDLAPGEHTITVEFPDGLLWTRRVSVRGGEKKCISLAYRPKSSGAPGQGDISESIFDCGLTATASSTANANTGGGDLMRGRLPQPTPAATPQPTPLAREADPPLIILPEEPVLSSGPDERAAKKKAMPPPPKVNLPTATSPPPPPPTDGTPRQPESATPPDAKPKDEDYTIVPIFYGTDRARTGATEPRDFYGPGRGKLEMGTCEVSIPKTHQPGQLEAPSVWRLEFKEDPKLHVVLLSVKPLAADEFNSQFRARLGEAKSRDVFVFVHGYNVKFVDAARRTAQLAYDLGFPGVPVLYSWPSQGSLSGYTTDENEIVWTEPHLKKFLADLAAQADGARVHLVAHSMGNRALTNVLRDLARENATPLFSEVILTAPDIDAEVFEQQLAPAIQKIARHLTLYASSSDAALLASKKVHGYQRAGDSAPTIIVVPGIDTIDASGIDTDLLGHSYFAQMGVVMEDIRQLLMAGKLPPERSLLEQVRGPGKYWRLPAAVVVQNGGRPDLFPGARFLTVRNGVILAVLFAAFVACAVWLVLRSRRKKAVAA